MRDIKKSLGRKNPTEAFKKFFFYTVNRLPHRKTKCRYKRSLTFVTIIYSEFLTVFQRSLCKRGKKVWSFGTVQESFEDPLVKKLLFLYRNS